VSGSANDQSTAGNLAKDCFEQKGGEIYSCFRKEFTG
jgi:hypothetical protein